MLRLAVVCWAVLLCAVAGAQAPVPSVASLSGGIANAREPQAAVGADGRIYVAFGAGNAIYCTVSSDGGSTWGAPVRVAEEGVMSLGMRRGPRIAVTGRAVAISATCGRQGGGRDGDLLVWRSADRGRTWQGPARANDVESADREGLHAMAGAPDGTLACAWLDLRSKGTKLYAAFSRDGGATWGPNVLVYRSPSGTICECCHPTLAYDAKGRLYAMWRNVVDGNRDMYLATSDDGGKSFSAARKLGEGSWPLNACPMDGGYLAVAADGAVLSAWRRDREVFTCVPGASEKRIGEGLQPWLAAGPGGFYTLWLAHRPGDLLALLPGRDAPVKLAADADDPQVASAPDGRAPVVAVWSDASGPKAAVLAR